MPTNRTTSDRTVRDGAKKRPPANADRHARETGPRKRPEAPAVLPARVPPARAFRGAARYSRFVKLMKALLPIFAFAILAVVAVYTIVYDTDDKLTVAFQQAPGFQFDRRTTRPTFTGAAGNGQRYEVTADSLEPRDADMREIVLSGPKADLRAPDGGRVQLGSLTGVIDLEGQTVMLDGDVVVVSHDGYEFRTARVLIDLEQQTVLGDQPVTGTGPMGTVRADGFQVLDGAQRVRFAGNVAMTIDPAALQAMQEAGTANDRAPRVGAPDASAPDNGAPDNGAPDNGAPDDAAPNNGVTKETASR